MTLENPHDVVPRGKIRLFVGGRLQRDKWYRYSSGVRESYGILGRLWDMVRFDITRHDEMRYRLA